MRGDFSPLCDSLWAVMAVLVQQGADVQWVELKGDLKAGKDQYQVVVYLDHGPIELPEGVVGPTLQIHRPYKRWTGAVIDRVTGHTIVWERDSPTV